MYKDAISQEEIHQIDPSLNLIKKLTPSTLAVYLVENADGRYVLKMPHNYKGKLSASFLQRDNDLLTRELTILSALQGINGITHLQRAYVNDGKVILLKQYQEGDNFSEYTPTDEDIETLEKIVSGIHDKGVAGLVLNDSDIVKPSNLGQPVIVDLGLGVTLNEKDVSLKQFKRKVEQDYGFLRLLNMAKY